MSIFSFKVPRSAASTIKAISAIKPEKSIANLVGLSYYNPERSIQSQMDVMKYSGQKEALIKPPFDVSTIEAFYDSVTPNRLIIMYERGRGIFLTTHEHLFNMYMDNGVVEENTYEVIRPTGLFTLSIAGKYKTGIPYNDISGVSNNMGFVGGFSPVSKLIRHKVNKPIVKFRSSLGESETTKDHSYILMNGQTATPEELEEYVPGRIRYMNYDIEMFSYIRFVRGGSVDILFSDHLGYDGYAEHDEVIISAPSFSEFATFIAASYNDGRFENGCYILPITPFLVGLLDNGVDVSDEFITIDPDNNKRVYTILDKLFERFEVVNSWAFDVKFLQVLSTNLFDISCRCFRTKSDKIAAILSFYFMVSEIDYAISYNEGYYNFVDTRLSGLPIRYDNIKFEENDDYSGYVYDISVDDSQCFVDPIGMLTLHNTDGILRSAVSYYISRMPVDEMKIVANKPSIGQYISYRIKMMDDVFGCNIFGGLYNDIVRNLILYDNVFIHRIYGKRKYKGKKVVLMYEVLPISNISLIYNLKQSKLVGYLVDGYKEIPPEDVIHIYSNKPPGFFYGRPNTLAIINDLKVLRILEQNLEIMGVAYSTPQLVLKVGKPSAPASNPPNGLMAQQSKYYNITDADIEKQANNIRNLSPHDFKVIPWYHHIEGVNVSPPIDLVEPIKLFRHRIYQALGVDPIVMGDTDSRNRDASVVGQQVTDRNVGMYLRLILDVLNREIINNDFLEALNIKGSAYIHTPRVDMSDFFKRVNLGIMLWQSGIITQDEIRRDYLGLDPLSEDEMDKTYIAMSAKKVGGPEEAASQSKSRVNPTNQTGNIGSPAVVKKR